MRQSLAFFAGIGRRAIRLAAATHSAKEDGLLPVGWSAAPAGVHYYRHVTKPDGNEYRVAVACAAHEYADGSMEFWAPGSSAFPTKVEALG